MAADVTISTAATNTATHVPAELTTGRTIHQRIMELFIPAHPHLHECRLQNGPQRRADTGSPRPRTLSLYRSGNAISPDGGTQLTGHHAEPGPMPLTLDALLDGHRPPAQTGRHRNGAPFGEHGQPGQDVPQDQYRAQVH